MDTSLCWANSSPCGSPVALPPSKKFNVDPPNRSPIVIHETSPLRRKRPPRARLLSSFGVSALDRTSFLLCVTFPLRCFFLFVRCMFVVVSKPAKVTPWQLSLTIPSRRRQVEPIRDLVAASSFPFLQRSPRRRWLARSGSESRCR